ncbi:MAG: hypothetical protein MJ111_03465 [Clostridia bacterium]|nr:hypothetical protein [Candidatus Limimonas egerieequi]MCQ2489601.1 hypothetical protein [Clostridia bacterium]
MLKKNTFWRSYSQLLIGTVVMSLSAFLPWFAKLIAAGVALWAFRKYNKPFGEQPVSDNRVFFLCFIPMLIYLHFTGGMLNTDVGFGTSVALALSTLGSTLWRQLFIIGLGVSILGKTDGSKLSYRDAITIIGAYTISGIYEGFTPYLLVTCGVGFIALGLYMITRSLDTPIAVALLFEIISTYNQHFVLQPTFNLVTRTYITLACGGIVLIFGAWMYREYSLIAEEGEYNG